MTTATKAKRSSIDFLGTTLQVLLLPDSSFRIGVPQIAEIPAFELSKQYASRDIKRLLGTGFELSKVQADDSPGRPMNALTIPEFEKLLVKLAFAGNVLARQWVEASVGLTLTSLAHDAFGIKFASEERKVWLEQRLKHAKQFHPLYTRWLQADAPDRTDYGKQVNLLKAHAGVCQKNVADYSTEELHKLNDAEVRYDTLRNVGYSHKRALRHLR